MVIRIVLVYLSGFLIELKVILIFNKDIFKERNI